MTTRPFEGRNGSIALKRSRTFDIKILNHLTDRDIQICIDIHEHRFLTTPQIHQLHFNTEYRARVRTRQLYELEVLNRFRPPKYPGSLPWHYVLDRAGAEIVWGALNIEPSTYFDRNRTTRLVKSRRLEHLREINDFFCHLVHKGRPHGVVLVEWLGEYRSAKETQRIVYPDGIGLLKGPSSSSRFFLELDRGSERDSILETKIFQYDEVGISPHLPHQLLFCFSSKSRERSARPLLDASRLSVSTATLERHLLDPLGQNWLPIDGERRLKILELPTATWRNR